MGGGGGGGGSKSFLFLGNESKGGNKEQVKEVIKVPFFGERKTKTT